ncbi:hypothetical protein [Orrella sp. 11846]|uniref:hypothetical protein n=1 Tax=Orrella sp. 11846 TaxID=3409913 RepID=UPI003B5C1767
MPDESGWTPKNDKLKTKGQGNPWALVFFAAVAFIAGAPIIFSIIILVVAIFVWRKQVALKSLNKMPPLPQKTSQGDTSKPLLEEVKEILAQQANKAKNDNELGDKALNQTDQTNKSSPFDFGADWGREPDLTSDFKPEPAAFLSAEPTQPLSEKTTTRVRPTARRATDHTLAFRDPEQLRQALIAMAVLGPCRAQEPFQDPLHSVRRPNEPTSPPRQTDEH